MQLCVSVSKRNTGPLYYGISPIPSIFRAFSVYNFLSPNLCDDMHALAQAIRFVHRAGY